MPELTVPHRCQGMRNCHSIQLRPEPNQARRLYRHLRSARLRMEYAIPPPSSLIELTFSIYPEREVNFSFPSQLQACPSGGCNWLVPPPFASPRSCVLYCPFSLWSWIHDWRGGTTQTTHSFFKCRVTNPAAPGRKLGKAVPAQDCAGDKAKCARGAKQPMCTSYKSLYSDL